MMLSIFSCAFWPFVCLRRNVYLDLPILWLGGLFDIELHELFVYFGGESLLVASFATIFSHSENCLFILFVVSFAVPKLLSLIRSHLFIFVLNGSNKILLWFMSKSVLPMFFTKVLWCLVSHLGFNLFWVYFCVCVRENAN